MPAGRRASFASPEGLLGLDRVLAGCRQTTNAAGLLVEAPLRLGDVAVRQGEIVGYLDHPYLPASWQP